MILYIDREAVPDLEHPPAPVLAHCLRKAEQAAGRYERLRRYYRGEHDIYRQPGDTGVRVAANYAKYVVDITLGYYLGEPVKYDANARRTSPGEGPSVVGEAIDLSPLLACYDRQHMEGVDLELGRTMGILGDCLELCYASDEADPSPRSVVISPERGILVCDTTVEHRKLFGLLWDRRERIGGGTYYAVTLCTHRAMQEYRADDLQQGVFRPVGPSRPHYFGAVPLIAYENNGERQGDFEQVISLIDAYDRLLSDRVTDKRKFVDALLVFFGMTLAEGDESRLVERKFLDGAPLDARAEYIQKTFDEAGVQVLADALVREIHKQTLTVDMSDERFSGNASGQALKLKLLTMNLLVKGKLRQMEGGLRERFRLYNHWLGVKGAMRPVSEADVDVVFTLSLPINEQEVIQLVTALQGIVDDQTLLAQLWFIRDPAEALENIRRQKRENLLQYQQTLHAGTGQETWQAARQVAPYLNDR